LKNQLQANDSKLQKLEGERKNLLEQVSTLTEKLAVEKEKEKLNDDIKSKTDQEAANADKLAEFQTL